ncbi:Z1 domain-containing protein [Chloroflexota bacterium]
MMEGRPIGLDPVQVQVPVWGPSIDGEEIRHLHGRYQERLTPDDFDGVVATAASVLGRCPRPQDLDGRVTGLALGKVQSGKTLSYTALIALAIDNNYRITVVLAGTKNPLLDQNYNRIVTDLEATRPSVTSFKNPLPQDTEIIRSVLHGKGHALIVVLKNRMRLDNTRRVLSAPELRGFPTLIIDDEGDESSLNTQFRRGRHSAIYASILRLRDALKVHAYVAYTATPQANLLINGIDGLSPDFGLLIEPGEGYCGGSIFFGADRDQYVRVVPLAEAEEEHVLGIPDGLKQGIATFLIGGAIRHLKERNAWHSMLIHNSPLRVDHERLQVSIRNLIGLWRERLDLPDSDPGAQELIVLMREAYDDLCTTVTDVPSWDEIRQQLVDEIWLVEVWMVNSLPLGRDPIGTPFRLRNNILIGGNMLGRGVTIEGLAVTYITRRARNETNADTMEQRARWFGYKQPYLDVCRIFITAQLRDDYTELLRHEDDFWEALRRNQKQGLSVRDWPRMFSLDMNMGLRPTRTNVAAFRQFHGSGWDIQNKVILDPQIAQRNIETIRNFFRKYPGQVQRYGTTEHTLVRGCQTEQVITDLLGRLDSEGTDWEREYNIEFLARLLVDRRLTNMDVVWMSQGTTRLRSCAQDRDDNEIAYQVENLMQGPTPSRSLGDPEYYPGDRGIHDNRVQLQVHLVQLRSSSFLTSALALFVPPDDPHFDLRYVVRDEIS